MENLIRTIMNYRKALSIMNQSQMEQKTEQNQKENDLTDLLIEFEQAENQHPRQSQQEDFDQFISQ